MLFGRRKHVSSVCPKTGRILKPNKKHRWVMWLFPTTGLLALVWFLIRVIPKPSRATYPCQRVAFPLASGFVVWLAALISSTLAYRKARRLLHRSRYAAAGICVAVAVMVVWLSLSITSNNSAKATFTPTDPPNSPMGVAKGIHPGRVVWIHDPYVTSCDSSDDRWWYDNSTDQNTVDNMMGKSIRTLVSEPNDTDAWDALFRHYNQTKGKGDVGYQTPEKIVIKINENNQNNHFATEDLSIDASPQMVRALLRQLVYQAGVPQTAIIVYDAMRPISDPVYNCCHPEFPDVDYRSGQGYPNILSPNFTWVSNAITYSVGYTASDGRNVPQCVLDAEYMINMAILKKHSTHIGVTLCFKNHFGTIGTPSGLHGQGYWQSNWGMDANDLLVDITGHEDIGAKTVLYIIDGLYGSKDGVCEAPTKWSSAPFNNDWPSSIFVSQDPVAIDSVGLDFLRAETGSTLLGNADNYLHEAALANDPCSGTFYDPEDDGTRLESLGVHEHWNNSTDKQYSRNLGTGSGIELVIPPLSSMDGPIENLTTGKRYDYIRLAIKDAAPGDEIAVSEGTYCDNIDFEGKNLTLRSTNPNNPAVVAATVINGGNKSSVVTFASGEDESCVFAGFTVTNGCVYGFLVGGSGGGILCKEASSPTINNCIINSNSAEFEGGGISCWDNSSPTITNCIITGNSAMFSGGGGISCQDSNAVISNCTISVNTTAGSGGGMCNNGGSPTLTNCILWGNAPDEIYVDSGTPVIAYSDVQDGWAGVGNIETDPCFADLCNGDYHLKSEGWRWDKNRKVWTWDDVTSRCIDAGNPGCPLRDEPLSIPEDPNNEWGHNLRINMGCLRRKCPGLYATLRLGPVG